MAEYTSTEQRQPRLHFNGVLLGLLPLLVLIVAICFWLLAGACVFALLNLLQVVIIALWSVELLAGLFRLFNRHSRVFAINLICALSLSIFLGFLLLLLVTHFHFGIPSPFCPARS